MAITLTPSSTAPRIGTTITFALAGATASTRYVIQFLDTSTNSGKGETTVTTDGAGAATVSYQVQNDGGTIIASVRPETEYKGTTTAAATAATVTPVP